MALTKVEMWISIIGVVLIFAFSINLLGQDLFNSDIELDNRSQDYINEFSSNIDESNLESYATNQSIEDQKKNPIVETVTNLPIISDVLGGINFFIDKTKGVMSALSVVYNLPTFFLKGFGLPVGDFNHILNIIGATLFIVFTIMMVRLVK